MELQRRSHEDQINYLAGKLLEVTVQRNAAQRQLRQQCDAVTDTNEMLDEALVVIKDLLELYSKPEPDSQENWQGWFDDAAAKSALWKRGRELVAKHA